MDMIILLWMMVQYEVITSGNKVKIDAAFIKAVSDKHFDHLKKLITDSLIESEMAVRAEKERLYRGLADKAENEKARDEMLKAEMHRNEVGGYKREDALVEIINAITITSDYSEIQIKKAFAECETDPYFYTRELNGMAKAVLAKLREKEKRGKKNKKTDGPVPIEPKDPGTGGDVGDIYSDVIDSVVA